MATGTAPLSDIWQNNILFRLRPGGNIQRATFTRAATGSYVQHNGVGAVAAAGKLRVQWVDLDGDGIRETPGYLLEGARTQLVTDPENFGNWSIDGTPARTSGINDPYGGTAAWVIDDNDAAAVENIRQIVTFTGDGTKALLVHVARNSSNTCEFGILGTAWRHRVRVTFNADGTIASVTTRAGSGTIFPSIEYANKQYAILVSVNGVVAAETNQFFLYPVDPDLAANVGATTFFGANAWNAPFPSSYQGPSGGASPSVADSLTVPFNFGPVDLTVLARVARPVHADASGDIGALAVIASVGGAAPLLPMYFLAVSRTIQVNIDTTGTDAARTAAIPAGAEIVLLAQFRNLTTGGQVAIDVGSGLSAFSTAASVFSTYGNQTLTIGNLTGQQLYGVLTDLIVARGLYTRQQMLAIS